MSQPSSRAFFDHIDQRVRSTEAARPFYDAFMGALGMRRFTGDDVVEWVGYAFEDGEELGVPFFGLMASPDHRPDETRIAFHADSRAEVDRIARTVVAAGAREVEGPELCLEYGPTYYAVFFEDQDGNRFEICCRGQGA